MSEGQVLADIRLALGKLATHTRLLRNNRGKAWAGKLVSSGKNPATGKTRVIIDNAQLVEFGLVNGASDLIGPVSVVVTSEMVGTVVALFGALEVKDKGKPTDEQDRFVNFVCKIGGVAGFVRSPDEALALVRAAPGRPAP